jgi:hypothetical protein
MAHENKKLQHLLQNLNLGSSVAEFDDILNIARVDTSAFSDIFNDSVDLIQEQRDLVKQLFSEFLLIFYRTPYLRTGK